MRQCDVTCPGRGGASRIRRKRVAHIDTTSLATHVTVPFPSSQNKAGSHLYSKGGEARERCPRRQKRSRRRGGLNGTQVRWVARRRLPPARRLRVLRIKGNGRVGRARVKRGYPAALGPDVRPGSCSKGPHKIVRRPGFGSPRRSPSETSSDLNHKSSAGWSAKIVHSTRVEWCVVLVGHSVIASSPHHASHRAVVEKT